VRRPGHLRLLECQGMRTTLDALSVAMLLIAAGSLGATFTLQCAVRARLKLRKLPARKYYPPISVLKPLCGVDEGLYENLASFARQKYPQFELIFGVCDADDPALAVVQRLRAEFPDAPMRLVVHGETDPVANPKVLSLLHSIRVARYEYVLVSDSNVSVEPDYLEHIGSEMGDPDVGLVSNIIVARGGESVGAQCENLHLNTVILGGVCIADLGDRPCVVGKSMLMRKSELAELGGFESMRDILAEDYLLGQRYHEAGYRVVLSCYPISTVNKQLTFTRFLARHMRWAQLRRWCALGPFCGEPLLYATPWLTAPLLAQESLSPSGWAYAFAMLVRIGSDGMLARSVTGSWPSITALALIPVKDTLLLGVWVIALCRRNVSWRGHQLRIGPGTRLSARDRDELSENEAHAA
jgi:ceramide glucosyltransferase